MPEETVIVLIRLGHGSLFAVPDDALPIVKPCGLFQHPRRAPAAPDVAAEAAGGWLPSAAADIDM